MKIGVCMDRMEALDLSRDTTCLLIFSALRLGYQVCIFHGPDLCLEDKTPYAATSCTVRELNNRLDLEDGGKVNLNHFDLVLMRINPEVDMEYMTYTYILDFCSCRVLNSPKSLRNCPEKIWHMFHSSFPPTLITQEFDEGEKFAKAHGSVVLKPLYGRSGCMVRLIHSGREDFRKIFESYYKTPVLLQKYVDARCSRVTVMGGEIVSHVEMPKVEGDFRHNMTLHRDLSRVKLKKLSREDLQIGRIIDLLTKNGVFFAGIDMMGHNLIEVNITSPGLLLEVSQAEDKPMAELFWSML